MAFIQNISEEKQLVRVQGEKKTLNPGEIAEVNDQEFGVIKTYSSVFAEVKQTIEGNSEEIEDFEAEKEKLQKEKETFEEEKKKFQEEREKFEAKKTETKKKDDEKTETPKDPKNPKK